MNRPPWILAGLLLAGLGCGQDGFGELPGGGGDGDGTKATITGASGPDGTPAVYHDGSLPAPKGSLDADVIESTDAINGGSVMIPIDASGDFTAVYVSVMGSTGYWKVTIPVGVSATQVLLTLAQELPPGVTIVIEIADRNGNVSDPITVDLSIHQVGTGDVQVNVTWDIDNDLDLHVVDPKGTEVYWSRKVSPEGGTLDSDSNAGCRIDGIRNENIVWPLGTAPRGKYTVRVDHYANCKSAAVNYAVTVQKHGQPAQTFSGSFSSAAGDHGGSGSGTTVTTFTF